MPPGSEPASGSVRPKQPIHSPETSLGRYFLLLRLGAVGVDRIHHQRGLHAHHRAIAGIDALDLARHQPVGDVARAAAPYSLRDGHTEQAGLAHQAEEFRLGRFVEIGFLNARQEFRLAESGCRVADHALFIDQLVVEKEGVFPGFPGSKTCWAFSSSSEQAAASC
jgi:hypothetical protein